MRNREALEGFALETLDGLIFTVKGMVHPPDRTIAYLRYIPDPVGDRQRGDTRYRRVYHWEEQRLALQARHPSYLRRDPAFGIPLPEVPGRDVGTVYDPRRRLSELSERGPIDPLEETALALADLLTDRADIPSGALGLSGSLLVDLQGPDSDVDVVVYGEEESRAVHRALRALLEEPSSPVRRPHGRELAAVHEMHRVDTPLSFSDFARLQERKVNEGRFRGRQYFVRFVKRPGQTTERYGDPRFEPLGSASIRARVENHRDAIFTPCRYAVVDVTFSEGDPVSDLREIVSFRGRFSEQAKTGEWVLARGGLERVIPRNGPSFHRLTVGGGPGDYLLSERI